MDKNIVQIDLGKIDAEILELNQRIDLLVNTKKYAESIAIGKNGSTPSLSGHSFSQNMGVSDFIRYFLKKTGKTDTKTIIKAYSDYTHKAYDDISGNVSNALSRLKTDEDIKKEDRPGGRKAGSIWSLND